MRVPKVEVTSLSLGPEPLDRRKTPYVDVVLFPTLKALRAYAGQPKAIGACLVWTTRGKQVAELCFVRPLSLPTLIHEAFHAAKVWARREGVCGEGEEEWVAERLALIVEGVMQCQ